MVLVETNAGQGKQVGDTFLDLGSWGKGVVWVNGHNLGRYWDIGPQKRLYCPAPFLKAGTNEIVVFDLHVLRPAPVAGFVDLEPLAAASIAQVHRAQLKDGTEVVVKIRRPGIVEVIEADLKFAHFCFRRFVPPRSLRMQKMSDLTPPIRSSRGH